jgi:hypothetical protein
MDMKDREDKQEAEVAALRRQLRITQGALALAVLGFGFLFAASGQGGRSSGPEGQSSETVLPRVDTRELVLWDVKGKERGSLRCSKTGQPMLTLTGVEEKVELGFLGEKTFDVAALDFRDREGKNRADFGWSGHSGGLSLIDDKGNVRLSLLTNDTVGSEIKLKPSHDSCNGQSVLVMWMDEVGFTGIQLIDQNGKHVLDVPPLPPLDR